MVYNSGCWNDRLSYRVSQITTYAFCQARGILLLSKHLLRNWRTSSSVPSPIFYISQYFFIYNRQTFFHENSRNLLNIILFTMIITSDFVNSACFVGIETILILFCTQDIIYNNHCFTIINYEIIKIS